MTERHDLDLDLARRHVDRGGKIITAQEVRVARAKAAGFDCRQHTALLETFCETQRLLEQDLLQLMAGRRVGSAAGPA